MGMIIIGGSYMSLELTGIEISNLYKLISEDTTDIILKTDRHGFIQHASLAMDMLGVSQSDMLVCPHILDLVRDRFKPAIDAAHRAAIDGQPTRPWVEAPLVTEDGSEQWHAIRMRSLTDDHGEVYGVLSVMRNIEEARSLRESLFAAELTDSLTGLTNRRAFISMLQHLLDQQSDGWLAVFDIRYFKAINMRYGLSAGDQFLEAFASLLRTLSDSDSIVSRIGAQRFSILLPEGGQDRMRSICKEIISTLAGLSKSISPARLSITASVGITPIEQSLDSTMKALELALFRARIKGSNCIEITA
ncbi:GGDEF domain-containing protein [Altererythrobacter sp. SALINAS58]|uniref:GGDEF domain-containing protein n=1 Tax=Alteripontixanthobacter muriae TaxID=2705546 RepID=UPI001575A7D5|nr:sensor domain-containing diguanylate cyclase [Alteripontixanthobacter muriae]NTZ43828.1 GGDEF domain-containing protein [Alteripontixanthobacter muriae]